MLLVGDVLISSEDNELLVFIDIPVGELGRLERCCMIYRTKRCCGAIRRWLMTCAYRWCDARCCKCRTQPRTGVM